MNAAEVEFLGGPQDGAEIPAKFLAGWEVGSGFAIGDDEYRFEELADGRRVARFLGHEAKRSS